MGQIKMADYSNFLSEADESNLQYEVIFCEKRRYFFIINLHVYMLLFAFLNILCLNILYKVYTR